MIPIPLHDGNSFFIDNTFFEKLVTCFRSAEYYGCWKKESAQERPALEFGRIIHEALELRYSHADMNDIPHISSVQYGLLEALFDVWHPPEEDHRNYGYAIDVIEKYNETYPKELFKVLEVEKPFAMPLGSFDLRQDLTWFDPEDEERTLHSSAGGRSVNVVWTGKIDLIYELNGRVYVMDHKTSSVAGSNFFSDFELATGMQGYCVAARDLLGHDVNGYAINALFLRRPTKTGKGIEFQRQSYELKPHVLSEWRSDIVCLLGDYLRHLASGYTPKGTKWCLGKYGKCSYHDVCLGRPEDRQTLLRSSMFKDVTWEGGL